MKKLLLLLISILFIGCSYTTKNVNHLTEFCLLVDDYYKVLCLDSPVDTSTKYIFIDKNRFQREQNKFNNLFVYKMKVVDIEKNGVYTYVTLSNDVYSIVTIFDKAPKLEEIYNVICIEKNLSPSVLLKDGVMSDPIVDYNEVEVETYTDDIPMDY